MKRVFSFQERASLDRIRSLMSNRLQDKRCLIVGGTSGIGLAAATRFLQEGARLVVAGLDDGNGPVNLAELQRFGEISFRACDAAHEPQVDYLFEKTLHFLGGLDILYHVAGISGRRFGDGPLHECTEAGWQTTIDVNLKSVFLTNRAAVRQFLQQASGGTILNMASVLALSPSPHYFDTFAYAASKGGVIAMSRQAAARYASQGIRVNVLAPGLIDTPMSARAVNDPAIQAFLRTKQPLAQRQGAGQPEDCSEAAVFLCSEEARFITGVVLPVDGGWSISDGQWADGETST
jgi:NAD(P)-dependent dehydrogenase (short-subunit alcohol dehydrogenase family)